MGVFLDTSVPIRAQRTAMSYANMQRRIFNIVGDDDLGTSSIVMTELIHGVYRAKTPDIWQRRQDFVAQFLQDVAVYSYELATAELAGRIGGEQASAGRTVPPVDLMIGATALSLGYSIMTTNLDHFRLIPNLTVIPF